MLPFLPYVLIDVRRQMSARHSARQGYEVLTVIHSLVINHGRNKIMFVYSLDDWHKRSGVVSFYTKLRISVVNGDVKGYLG